MTTISSKRIIINTCAQYVRTILSMVLALVATRVILKSLGVEDYGIYSVVAGAVSILSFLTSSLIITTQRYLSVTQGKQDTERSRSMFNNSIFLHVIITLVVVVLLQILFIYLFKGLLNIPDAKIHSAKLLYQFVTIVLCLTFLTSPYRAVVVSHENIVYISVIETIDAVFKLLIAYSLFFFTGDKLVIYGALLTLIQVFNFVTLSIYSYAKYEECGKIKISDFDFALIKKMFSFAGWTMYNIVCNLGRTQGIAIGLNKFYGAAINASYGLAFQVSGTLSNVSQSLLNAINPQLMKAEGAGDRTKMLRIAEIESKFAFFLLSALAIPCIFEMPRLLELWLDQVPEKAVLFCRMVVLAALTDSITVGLGSANQAEGNIRNYTLTIYSIKLLTLPVVIILLLVDANMIWIAFCYVGFELISSSLRIPFLARTTGLNIKGFIKRVVIKEIIPTIGLIVFCLLMILIVNNSYRFIGTFSFGIIIYLSLIVAFGLCADEKGILKQYILLIINKIKNNE